MTTTQFSLAATEQLRHYLFVRERTGPTSCHPLIMLLQHGVGFRGVEVISRGTLFQRPQSPVLIDRDHHRGRAAATSPSATPRRRRGSSPPARRRPRTACWPGVVNGSPTRRHCLTGPGCGPSTRLFGLTADPEAPGPAYQPGGLLIVAITAYWQHGVVEDRACPVVTW